MKNLKLFLLPAVIIGLLSVVGCSKSGGNTTVVKTDSVFYSAWIPLKMSFDNTDSVYFETIAAKSLTQTILSKGVILTYVGYDNLQSVTPDTVVENAADVLQQYWEVGNITVYAPYPYDFTWNPTQDLGYLFRYVLIPGSIVASTSIGKYDLKTLKKMTLTDVTKALNTPAVPLK